MPRCKHCKEKFEAIRFNQKYCLKSECVKVWVDQEKQKRMKEQTLTAEQIFVKALDESVNKL